MPTRPKCVRCNLPAALSWTLFNGVTACIVPLCMEHAGPLTDLVNLVGPNPTPTASIPTVTRLPKARPLSWIPPEEA